MSTTYISAENFVGEMAGWLKLGVEAVGVAVIGIGLVVTLIRIVPMVLHRRPMSFNAIRLVFARHLALALEFQLAADVLGTAIAPSWEQIGQLGAIAVIRTFLNYFLEKEMKDEEASLAQDSIDAKSKGQQPS